MLGCGLLILVETKNCDQTMANARVELNPTSLESSVGDFVSWETILDSSSTVDVGPVDPEYVAVTL